MKIFDMMASRYDNDERIEVAKVISNEIKEHVKNSEYIKDKTLVDYGCGTGLVGLDLVDIFKSVVFVDSSSNMIDQINQKIDKLKLDNVNTICGDLSTSSLKNFSADYIILSQVLLHVKGTENILNNIYNILNKDAHLIIVDFDKNYKINSDMVHNGFIQEDLRSMLENIGFSTVESNTFYHRKNMFMNEDASLFLLDAKK